MAKIVSLVVKIGAVVFILAIPQAYAIQLQLLGGIWIIQLLPPILLGLYTRGVQCMALLIGWAAGTALGTYMAATQDFISSVYPLEIFGVTVPGYAALYSVRDQFSCRGRALAASRSHGAAEPGACRALEPLRRRGQASLDRPRDSSIGSVVAIL